MSSEDTLAEMGFLHLHPYLQGNLAYVDLDFSLDDGDRSLELFYECQTELFELFETGPLKRYVSA